MFDLPAIPPLELTEQLRFILDLGAAVAAAVVGGTIAVRLRQPAILGYLLAGIVIGPFTPGFVGDVERITVLADVGVVLLLFALGVQFSIHELRHVGRVVIPGGIAQVLLVLAAGAAVMFGLGSEIREALVIGACLSLSSTLVVLKALIDRGELDSLHGRAAIGWSIVQDIATIVFIVSLPPLAGADIVIPFALAIAKAVLFLALAYLLGTRLLPWAFATVARLGSNELFLLVVFSTALLTAFIASAIFGLSLALGAFVAGVLISESELSHQAAAEITPFRDLFAVLFFVSVGMLVDPQALLSDVGLVALLVVIAIAGKGLLTAGLGRVFGLPARSAVMLGGLMAQVGEFSFILADDALNLGVLSVSSYNLVLGTAVVTILLSPFVGRLAEALIPRLERAALDLGPLPSVQPDVAGDQAAGEHAPTRAPGRMGAGARWRTERALAQEDEANRPTVVVLGAGRVGQIVSRAVRARGFRCVVVDRDARQFEALERLGTVNLFGDAANPEILRRCELDRARILVVAIGDPLTARLATERALRINPRLSVASRARGRTQVDVLRELGVGRIADPDLEAAFELARHALQRMGVSGPELSGIVTGLRRDVYGRDHA